MINLNTQQTTAYDNIMRWHKEPNNKRFVLAGYAGTGKTTLARYIEEHEGLNIIFLSFTGKAVNVLRSKGCGSCSTIHGYLYHPKKVRGELVFTKKSKYEVSTCDLLVIDEYSMLNDELIHDIESVADKVLYLGDPFQLPPIHGKNELDIDFLLTEIHRQALESNIIRYATDVREGRGLSYCEHDDFVFCRKNKLDTQVFLDVEQLLVGYNKSRTKWNQVMRGLLGYGGILPNVGEKLICLQNNATSQIFNGMMGEALGVDDDGGDYFGLNFKPDGEDRILQNLNVWKGDVSGWDSRSYFYNKDRNRFDYGYCVTVHKAQGSEFKDILIYNEPIGRSEVDRRKWLYTAISRGKEKVYLVN